MPGGLGTLKKRVGEEEHRAHANGGIEPVLPTAAEGRLAASAPTEGR